MTKQTFDDLLMKSALLVGVLLLFLAAGVGMRTLEHYALTHQSTLKNKRAIKKQAEEVYHLASIINAECGTCTLEEKRMIGAVVINRARYSGQSILEIISAESQFHGFNSSEYYCTEEHSTLAESLLKGKRNKDVTYFFTGEPEWADSLTIVKKKGFIHTFAY